MAKQNFRQLSLPANISLVFILFTLMLLSCKSGGNGTRATANEDSSIQKSIRPFRILSPVVNAYLSPGEEVNFQLGYTGEPEMFDSVTVIMNREVVAKLDPGVMESVFTVPAVDPGSESIQVKIFKPDSGVENYSTGVRIVSDIEPETYGYRVIKTYPHDKGAFTQGLEFHDGFLYEGTGNYGESSLRKVDLESGEILKYRNLSPDLFGEGITRIHNKIFQITYRAQVGFVYDIDNFEVLRKIYYQIREGWGLTNNGEHILMSDGSHNIYFMDTTYFSVAKKIEVFDNNREVDLLNELELIDGVLYANRYTTREIVMIDPGSGKLLGRIDMSDILDPADRHPRIDYFNGIAWDRENDRIFVTGKYWTKLYQVEFLKR